MIKSTSEQNYRRLNICGIFLRKEFNDMSIKVLVNKIKDGSVDPYNILSRYCEYLKSGDNILTITIKQRVVTVKNSFEYCDIDINPRKFKLKVRLPKAVRKNKEAISKKDVIEILNNCSDIRLKTYVMLLAATGMRASEALNICVKDVDFDNKPAIISIRGENTKTKTDRIVFLTNEATNQLNAWLKYKHRTRRVCYQDKYNTENNNKTITEYRTPNIQKNDLVFSVNQIDQAPDPKSLYSVLSISFGKTLDRMGKGEKEDNNERRRQITLHSFRRFVNSTISDLVYSDYSE